MKKNKSFLAVAVLVACCVIAVWFSASIRGSENTYELRPRVAVPEHKSDIVRVVDAYERLMERYLDLTERNSAMVGEDIRAVAVRLDSIDDRLAELAARTARIERALGIKQPSAQERNEAAAADSKSRSASPR